jgi:hypothetical protein
MNILPIEFRVLGGMWCGDVVALNGSGKIAPNGSGTDFFMR